MINYYNEIKEFCNEAEQMTQIDCDHIENFTNQELMFEFERIRENGKRLSPKQKQQTVEDVIERCRKWIVEDKIDPITITDLISHRPPALFFKAIKTIK